MAKDKLTYSVSVPKKWSEFITLARKHLHDTGYKHGETIFVYDVFMYGLKLFAKELQYELENNGLDIEFVSANSLSYKKIDPMEQLTQKLEANADFREEEYRIAKELSDTPKGRVLLQEYELEYKPKGLSLQEYIHMKDLDL